MILDCFMNLKLMQLPSAMDGRSYYIPVFFLVTLSASVLTTAIPRHRNRRGNDDEKVAELGENITLRCSTGLDVTGNNSGHFTWRLLEMNGTSKVIAVQDCMSGPCIHNSSDDRFHVDLNKRKGTANLVISEVHPSDLGNYVCLIVARDGMEESTEALIIIPPVDISCSGCEIDGPDHVKVEVGTEVSLSCSTGDEFNANISLNADGIDYTKENASVIRFMPTLKDDGKQIECIVESEVKNQRNITLHVKGENKSTASTDNGRTTITPTTRAKATTASQQTVCFYAGVFDDEDNFLQFAKCYEPKTEGGDVLVLANSLPNTLGIVSCTGDVCTDAIKVKIQDDDKSTEESEEKPEEDNNLTMTTYLCISLYVVIGMAFLAIVIVLIWRKRKGGVSVQVNYHDYTEPCSAPLHHPRPPSSPVSEWSTTSTRTNYPASQYYPSSTIAEDDELQELSTTWEDDMSPGAKRHSLVRSLSARARKSFRDSTVVYGNVPFVTIMDRVKTVGFSYF